jgi:hypothetical protein
MPLELFFVMFLISCVPVAGFFPPGAPAVFLRGGCAGYVTLWRDLVLVPITTFLLSVRRLEFFDGVTRSPCSFCGECWVLCTVGVRPPRTTRVADCYSVEELGFQLLERKDMAFLLEGIV